ncbi:MAG: MarC family protein [Simkaniaceae bacterium]|nr:MarC family protein [Simkaniaceae bacterium]
MHRRRYNRYAMDTVGPPTLFSVAFSLFLLMDAVGNVPVYISVLRNIPPERQRKIIVRELLIALGIIVGFGFLGDYILELLRISEGTIRIAGGMILLIIAIRMIFPPTNKERTCAMTDKEEPFVVPLAIPMVAGPAVLTAVAIYSHEGHRLTVNLAIIVSWVATFVILLSAPSISKVLGHRGMMACERLMGLLLTLLSVQMLVDGVLFVARVAR